MKQQNISCKVRHEYGAANGVPFVINDPSSGDLNEKFTLFPVRKNLIVTKDAIKDFFMEYLHI